MITVLDKGTTEEVMQSYLDNPKIWYSKFTEMVANVARNINLGPSKRKFIELMYSDDGFTKDQLKKTKESISKFHVSNKNIFTVNLKLDHTQNNISEKYFLKKQFSMIYPHLIFKCGELLRYCKEKNY